MYIHVFISTHHKSYYSFFVKFPFPDQISLIFCYNMGLITSISINLGRWSEPTRKFQLKPILRIHQ